MQMYHLCPELPLCKLVELGVGVGTAVKCQKGPGSPPPGREPPKDTLVVVAKKALTGEMVKPKSICSRVCWLTLSKGA